MKKISTFLVLLLCLLNLGAIPDVYGQTPTALPYSQNFNTANDLTLLNGTQTNKWSYGAATGNTGSSLYISNNGGTANAYTVNSSSIVQAYKDLIIPSTASIANFSFDWKGQGESIYDYLRVWIVPTTFTPTPGTQITAAANRIQVGGELNGQATWQTFSTINLNLSQFMGSNMRLVFEWRNDFTAGTQPPIAIDNINISIPSCFPPTATAVNTITTNSAVLSWTAPAAVPGNGYEYYISTNSAAPTAATPGVASTGTTATVTLTPSTTYYWWVRSVCSATDKSVWIAGNSFSTLQVPTTIPYVQNFSTANDLQLTSLNQTNKWVYGSATGNPANSLYISNNGTANAYTISSTSTVHAFRDLLVPAGTTFATLSFDWKGDGESIYDYLKVWLVPVTYNPAAGTQITAGAGRIQVGGTFNQQSTWQNYFDPLVNLTTFAGQTVRLVFEWKNDGSGGTQPPIAIDNINLSIPTCKIPTNITVSTVGSATATITWTAPSPAPAGGYQYYLSTVNVPPTAATVPTGASATNTLNLTSLTPNTTYYIWIRSVCAGSDRSFWMAGGPFTTTQIPATIPYIQPFTTGSDLGYANGSQVNKWIYGNATGNTGGSVYISNTGTTNAYSTSSTSIVHAYRDIAVPAGTTTATFSFDWKAAGESSFDYMKVWLVPASFMPVAGTGIAAGTGRIQIGNNYNQQTTWQTVSNPALDISSFAGATMRLVFEWRNDGSAGTQPPAAIDNINLRICSNATPVVTVGTATYNSVVLTWPQDIGGASYLVRYRPVGSTGPWQSYSVPTAASPATTNTTTLQSLLPATLYEVEIAAVCNGIPGVYSHSNFTTRCDPTPPNVTITSITPTSAVIGWGPLAASSEYFMRYRIVGSGAAGWSAEIPLPAAPATTFLLSPLNVYTTYEVQIANRCVGETTLNPWSNPKVFTTERTCDVAPPGLTITNLTPTMATVTWASFPGASSYILRYRKIGIPSWTTINANTNTVTLSNLVELTQYEMQVANVCSGTTGNFTPLYLFTTPTVTYCQMAATASTTEYISKVTVTPNGKPVMTNTTLASTYSDYTGVTNKFIEMVQGSSNNQITIEKKLAGNAKAGVAVWIDFNRNGYFDIDERVLVSGADNSSTVSGTFSVPADAFISLTDFKYVVMRVAMQKDGIPVNCTNFASGEVEDYTVRITKQIVPNPINQTDILIYPNPVKTVLNVKNISPRANYKIYNTSGQLVTSGIILNNKVDVRALINGIYVIDIDDVKGAAQKKFIKE
ncbi:fibronectin type III domain-containing protein [uncultured Chryseobacterium sp.]|uniref:fibronectin type III domain-containing protein n=1 Tax=uncultured Chryseobacterium sp. TaxID=259322 RepID=UPI0025D015D4|nr:fibronectin type III domain-containing protein [uncultured Chryseobacterium sp.]